MTMPTFTVFCRESSGQGTTYISSESGDTWQDAARTVRERCADDWDMSVDDIDVIGVAAGDVDIVTWDDDANVLPDEPAPPAAAPTTAAPDSAPLPVIHTLDVEGWQVHVSRGEDDGAMIVSIDSSAATGPKDHTKEHEPRLFVYVDDVARYDHTKND